MGAGAGLNPHRPKLVIRVRFPSPAPFFLTIILRSNSQVSRTLGTSRKCFLIALGGNITFSVSTSSQYPSPELYLPTTARKQTCKTTLESISLNSDARLVRPVFESL